jgi:chemotaxis protein CheD
MEPAMKEMTIACGDYGVRYGEGMVLQTGSLGAGVAVVVLDAPSRTAGLAHVALPVAPALSNKTTDHPGFFADSAIQSLLAALRESGVHKDAGELTVKIVGGTNVLDQNGVLDLGKRNVEAVRQALQQANLQIETAETGGRFSRSVKVYADSGMVEMITPGHGSVFI